MCRWQYTLVLRGGDRSATRPGRWVISKAGVGGTAFIIIIIIVIIVITGAQKCLLF